MIPEDAPAAEPHRDTPRGMRPFFFNKVFQRRDRLWRRGMAMAPNRAKRGDAIPRNFGRARQPRRRHQRRWVAGRHPAGIYMGESEEPVHVAAFRDNQAYYS